MDGLNILKKGFPLWVCDMRRAARDEVVGREGKAPEDLADLGKRCSWIVFSLPDSAVVESVLFGTDGLKPRLRPGHIILDCGTTHPLLTRQTSARLQKEGVIFMDAPVSGMVSLQK